MNPEYRCISTDVITVVRLREAGGRRRVDSARLSPVWTPSRRCRVRWLVSRPNYAIRSTAIRDRSRRASSSKRRVKSEPNTRAFPFSQSDQSFGTKKIHDSRRHGRDRTQSRETYCPTPIYSRVPLHTLHRSVPVPVLVPVTGRRQLPVGSRTPHLPSRTRNGGDEIYTVHRTMLSTRLHDCALSVRRVDIPYDRHNHNHKG
jgi:hypothetical protein